VLGPRGDVERPQHLALGAGADAQQPVGGDVAGEPRERGLGAGAVDQAGVGGDELGGGGEIGHAASVANAAPCGLNGSDFSPAGAAPVASSAAGEWPERRPHSRVRCAWSA
jgi:hypothetical protein